jgi:polar amino acid transport system substrate-binding protein
MKIFLSYILIILIFTKVANASSTQVRLCYEDVIVYPWITGDQNGLALTQLKIVQKSLNLKFDFVRLPWKRCQMQARAGLVDGLIAASYNKGRTQWGTYPMDKKNQVDREYRTHIDSFYIYVRKDSHISWDGVNFQNLKDSLVGTQLGYSVGDDLRDQGHKINSSFTTSYDLLKALDNNMIKVAVLQKYAAIKTLKENPILGKKIEKIEIPFKVADQYVMFNTIFFKNNSELCHKIWRALALSRKDPEYLRNEQTYMQSTITKNGSASL